MVEITKLGVATAHTYFKQEFAAASNSYLSQDGKSVGIWNGKGAEVLGVAGAVEEDLYHRMIEGQHPVTGEQLIKHRDTRLTADGKEVAHIPAWDITISLPKSISLAAVVGGDERLLRIAERANQKGMEMAQHYSQARGGGHNPPINTRNLIWATFRHDTARPVDGYPAAQLHFHNVVMNMVHDNGKWRSLQTAEIYRIQRLIRQVVYDELLREGRRLGYEMHIDPVTLAPEIKGFTEGYLKSESLRSEQIKAELEKRGLSSPRAAQIIALASREQKLDLTGDEVRELHQANAAAHGDQPKQEIAAAIERGEVRAQRIVTAEEAVDHARKTLSERLAVFEHPSVVREALKFSQGTVTVAQIETEIKRRVQSEDLLMAPHGRANTPEPIYRTPEAIEREQYIIERMRLGKNAVDPIAESADMSRYKQLADNPIRQNILAEILGSRHRVMAINGTAGSAKSTAANILRQEAEARGYRVLGLAPTGGARDALQEKGINAKTLQWYLKRNHTGHQKTLYILDESSLVSARQMKRFFSTIESKDHVLLIGDDSPDPKKVGQYLSVESGRIFQQLQEAGMPTAEFNRIYRQKEEKMKSVVKAFRVGDLDRGFGLLEEHKRVHEHESRHDRYKKIAETFCEQPVGTTVAVPDNKGRRELGAVIRQEMRDSGHLHGEDRLVNVLISRDMTDADLGLATSYRPGNVAYFRNAVKQLGIQKGTYATVITSDSERNRIVIRTNKGQVLSVDPRYGAAGSIYESRVQPIAAGERVQFTQKGKFTGAGRAKAEVSTRDLATINSIDQSGNVVASVDRSGDQVRFNVADFAHLDYSYCMTGHSLQGLTNTRTIWNVEASDTRLRALLTQEATYVCGSRPEHDLQVFCDSKADLIPALSHKIEAPKAMTAEEIKQWSQKVEQSKKQGYGLGV